MSRGVDRLVWRCSCGTWRYASRPCNTCRLWAEAEK